MTHLTLCCGQATVEVVGAVPTYPVRPGERQEMSAFTLQGGGTAANCAVTLVSLGARARFAGLLPDDFLGEFAASSLAEAGVDLTYLSRYAGGVGAFSFIALDESRRTRAHFFSRGDCPRLPEGAVPVDALEGVSLLVIDGAHPEAQRRLAAAARLRGTRVLLSARTAGPELDLLAPVSDTVIASEELTREFGPASPKLLGELLRYGCACAVVTLGRDGCVGQERGGAAIHLPAARTQLIDATGAGDVFRGAFAMAWLEGRALRERLRFATTAASLACESYGARAGIPSIDALSAALSRGID